MRQTPPSRRHRLEIVRRSCSLHARLGLLLALPSGPKMCRRRGPVMGRSQNAAALRDALLLSVAATISAQPARCFWPPKGFPPENRPSPRRGWPNSPICSGWPKTINSPWPITMPRKRCNWRTGATDRGAPRHDRPCLAAGCRTACLEAG